MAQKSLPTLNKVNTSMVWYSTFYFKNYKWLSSQYIYFLYFLNKLFIFLDLFLDDFMWIKFYNTYLYTNKDYNSKIIYKKIRFFKPVTSYIINIKSQLLVFNLYYKTTLAQFQEFNKVKAVDNTPLSQEFLDQTSIIHMYYR